MEEVARALHWHPIETCPIGVPVIFANFEAICLVTLTPHVWTGRYHEDDDGQRLMLECSFAATNENGEPTHWMHQPKLTHKFIEPYVKINAA